MQQRVLLGGAFALAIIGAILMVYTQTAAGHVLGPCTFSNGLIHCSAPFHPERAAAHSSHPLLLVGLIALLMGIGLAAWAVIPSWLHTRTLNKQETDHASA
jgi:hypothetical protein